MVLVINSAIKLDIHGLYGGEQLLATLLPIIILWMKIDNLKFERNIENSEYSEFS